MNMAAILSSDHKRMSGWLGFRFLAAVATCILVGLAVRSAVLDRQLDSLRLQARHHTEFYRLSLESLLSRNESLPRIIAMEPRLKALLQNPGGDEARHAANRYLLDVKNGADINSAFLIDKNGFTLAASNYLQPGSYVGNNYAFRPYFKDAMKGKLGSFYGIGATTGDPGYFLAAPIEDKEERIGAVTVKISLDDFESALVKSGDTVLLVDAFGVIFLASVPDWKYRSLNQLGPEALLQLSSSRQYNKRILQPLDMKLRLQDDSHVVRVALPHAPVQDFLVQSEKIGPLGWSIVLLADTKQERQNALLAGIAAGFAIAFLLSTVIYLQLNVRRYKERRQAEAALRQAHRELEQRIADRTADLRSTNFSLEEKIEALKTTERILHETRDNAVQAGKLAVLGQMAAGISHEVNQPLTALHAFTDNAVNLLERGRLEDVRENLGFIKQMAARMGHIVGEIKTFSRKPPLERQKLHISDAIDQAIMLVEPRRRQIDARIDVQEFSGDIQVWADLQRLEQVLVNLLRNGLDAVTDAAEKLISVAVSCKDSQVIIAIHDSGPGIPEDVFSHLFEPFFTTKTVGQGLGLGLAISRMIISELGGRLDAGNHASGGAVFTVVLEEA